MKKRSFQTLRLILGDQLNISHSWYNEIDENCLYVLMEVKSETGYVVHHIQKIVGFFLAMRNFGELLKNKGHSVRYIKLDDPDNHHNFKENIHSIVKELDIQNVQYQLPDEYRLDEHLSTLLDIKGVEVESFDSEHFLTERGALAEFFKGKKTYLMESFYRNMRKKYHVLMEDNGKDPAGGSWNYDQQNRKKLPKSVEIPEVFNFYRDASEITALLEKSGIETIGTIEAERFNWPVSRKEGLELLDHFLEIRLIHFGDYQDALTDRHWLLFHSRLSFVLNTKLISPLEVIKRSEAFWQENQERISLSQVEGFIRQILGWREYMRGVYWAHMPEYESLNFFEHDADLPDWFWTGNTKMKCLEVAINQSLEHAYAHHIQRLMVTGNFALLLGVHPDQLDEWYLGIYMDAIQWVELTNTRGMSQFADGGIVGTKPYVSSANYIHKMGDHCSNCHYDKKKKSGEDACPFNSLYWDFYDRHRDKLSNNPRVGMMYRTWDRMKTEDKEAMIEHAGWLKAHANQL